MINSWDKIRKILLAGHFLLLYQLMGFGQISKAKLLHSYNRDLPKSQIYSIIQDNEGFLWIGTRDGLLRSDGIQLVQFNTDKGLGFNYCHDLQIDNDNNLWIASHADYQGVSTLNLNDFKIENYPTMDPELKFPGANGIKAMDESRSGVMLFLSSNYQLFARSNESFNKHDLKSLLPSQLQSLEVYDIMADPHRENICWIAGQRVLFSYDLEKRMLVTMLEINETNFTNLFYEASQPEYIWASASVNGGIVRIHLEDNSDRKLFHLKGILDLVKQSDEVADLDNLNGVALAFKSPGEFWFATLNQGLAQFSAEEGKFYFLPESIFPKLIIRNIYSNSQGDLWIGTDTDGLHYISNTRSGVRLEMFEEELEKNPRFRLNSIMQMDENNYLLGFYRDPYLRYWNSITKQVVKIPLPEGAWAQDMIQLNSGTIMIATNWGLYHFNQGSRQFVDLEVNYYTSMSRSFDHILPYQDGYWLQNWPVGMVYYDENPEFYTADHKNNALPHPWVHDYLIDDQKMIWVGTEQGLGLIDPSLKAVRKFASKEMPSGFRNLNFKALEMDNFGRIWTSNFGMGISCFNPQAEPIKVTNFTTSNGMPSNRIYDLIKDLDGRIWFWSSEGLGVIQVDSMIDSCRIKYFPKSRSFRMEKLGTWFVRIDNQIYFGILGGFAHFNPNQLVESNIAPSIPIINELSLADETIIKIDTSLIQLQPKENYFQINFSTINYEQPENLEFAYQLKGFDDDWVFSGHRRNAIYTKIPPGNYQFLVKSRFTNGDWNSPPRVLSIDLLPPWYQTTAAKFIWAGLLILSGLLIYRFLLNRERLKHRLAIQALESEKLKSISKTKSNFFTQISHEFRTPLTVILGMADQLNKSSIDSFHQKASSAIFRNGRILLNHINQILDLTKLQSKYIQLDFRDGDIVAFVKYVLEAYQAYATSKGIRLDIEAPEHFRMDFDADRLKDVLSNLLSNAIKYNDKSDRILVFCSRILIDSDEFFIIQVSDKGIGIPADALKKIFQPYQRVDQIAYDGHGLGLAITKQWVEAMGGKIEVESKINMGSTFSVYLPVFHTAVAKQEDHFQLDVLFSKQEDRSILNNGNPEDELILMIDDHRDVLDYLSTCVSPYYQILTAKNGKEGLQKAVEHIPDVIISDIMMDQMDGYELLEQLKKNELTRHIPVILLTARSSQEEVREGYQRGADGYISKPFDQEELLLRIRNMIQHQQRMKDRYMSQLPERSLNKSKHQDEFLDRIETYVKAHLQEEFSVEDVAAHFHISRVQLYRKVKALSGRSASAYIRLIRLFEARKQLIHADRSISGIAYEVGFKDPNYFSRCFQDEFQISPSEFRIRNHSH